MDPAGTTACHEFKDHHRNCAFRKPAPLGSCINSPRSDRFWPEPGIALDRGMSGVSNWETPVVEP